MNDKVITLEQRFFSKNTTVSKKIQTGIRLLKNYKYVAFDSVKANRVKTQLNRLIASQDNAIYNVQADYWYATLLARNFKTDQAITHLNASLSTAKQLKNDSLQARALMGLGNIQGALGNLETSISLFESALAATHSEHPNKTIKSKIQLNLAQSYTYLGNLNKSIKLYFEILEDISQIDDKELEIVIYNNLSEVMNRSGQNYLAIEYGLKALKLCEDMENMHIRTYIHHMLTKAYEQQDKYDKAITYAKKSLQLAKQNNILFQQLISTNDIALLYKKKNDYKTAKTYFKKSISINELQGSKDHIILAYLGIALCNLHLGVSSSHFKTAQELIAESHLTPLYNDDINDYLLEYNYITKDYKKVIDLATSYIAKKKEADKNSEIISTLDILSKAYEKTNDIENALHYSNRILSVKDSIQKQSNLAALTTKSLMLKFNKERQNFKQKEAVQNIQLKQQQYATYVALLLVIVFIVIAYIIYRLYNQKRIIHAVLLQQKHKLDEMNTTKDKIFAVIGHDLRSPITALNHLITLMSDEKMTVSIMKKHLKSLGNFIYGVHTSLENILFWARNQLNGIGATPSSVRVAEIFNKITPILQKQIHNKSIFLENNIDDTIKAFVDAEQLMIVMRNVVSNAIKYTPKGGLVKVDAAIRNKNVEIIIEDSGIGIPKDIKDNLFKNAINNTKRGTEGESGTGIGLMLCKEFVEENKGTIHAESELNKGTKIFINLPIAS